MLSPSQRSRMKSWLFLLPTLSTDPQRWPQSWTDARDRVPPLGTGGLPQLLRCLPCHTHLHGKLRRDLSPRRRLSRLSTQLRMESLIFHGISFLRKPQVWCWGSVLACFSHQCCRASTKRCIYRTCCADPQGALLLILLLKARRGAGRQECLPDRARCFCSVLRPVIKWVCRLCVPGSPHRQPRWIDGAVDSEHCRMQAPSRARGDRFPAAA